MKGAWWVGKDDLDDDQREIITLPPDSSFMTIGPPGSGKTNLLVLRANYLFLAGIKNIKIIVFTRALREFIAVGGQNYDFPISKVVTSASWASEFLYERGIKIPQSEDFMEQRKMRLSEVQKFIEENKVSNLYDAIFLDEAQDYSPEEVEIFRLLTPRLIVAADIKQKIYTGNDCLQQLAGYVDKTIELEHHYRNGQKICRVADGLGEPWPDYKKMLDGCNYDEDSKPSSVEVVLCNGIEEEADEILKRLEIQLKAYPEELIGIVTPRKLELETLWNKIQVSEFGKMAVLHVTGTHIEFEADTRICVTTMHGAKGLEFRALHMAGCQWLKRFPHQRQLSFTAVTRCKTSLALYHSGDLPGYLESALERLEPVHELPEFSDVFGGA